MINIALFQIFESLLAKGLIAYTDGDLSLDEFNRIVSANWKVREEVEAAVVEMTLVLRKKNI